MVKYEINARNTALLVYDMLNDFIKPGFPREDAAIREKLVPGLKKLIECCRSQGIPIIYTVHSYRQNGSDIGLMGDILPGIREGRSFVRGSEGVKVYDEIGPEEGDVVIEKHRFGAFCGSDFDLILRSLHKDTLIVTGYSTNIGCETTVRDATNRDYKVIFPSDGCMSRGLPDMGWGAVAREDIQRVVLSTMAYRFAMVMTIEELVSRLKASAS